MNATSAEPLARPSAPAAPPSEPLLFFEQASKWYGSVLALNQVTLDLREGITGLVGANGAGKSTLMRLAAGLARPTLGRVTVRGVDAGRWEARRLVGYCPDVDSFYEDMTGREFVRTMARLCGFSRTDSNHRTDAVLEQVGMTGRADRRLRGYSKGMRQRVKLAQALLTDPPLVILDEPLSGIDPVGRQEMVELFRALAGRGKCLLISSHELEELEKLTSHVAIMARGRVAAVGTLQQIRDLLDDFPLAVRVDADRPRDLAKLLLGVEGVSGVNVTADGVTVTAKNPKRFYRDLGRLVVDELIEVRRLEPLDESAHAILGYLLGGSGKT